MCATKLCQNCGPIEFPHTSAECPVCGGELQAYGSLVDLALDMPVKPAGPAVHPDKPDVRLGRETAYSGRLF